MDPFLAAGLVMEMLDRVRNVDLAAIDRRALKCAVEDAAGRSNERVALAILAVAWLFADEQDARGGGSFSEHGLRSFPVQLTVRAPRRRTP